MPETLAEWNEFVCSFYEKMGDTRIMSDPARRDGLMKGFVIVYLRMRLPQEDCKTAITSFQMAVNEFTARDVWISTTKE